jgi:hypothetical protein
LNTPLTKFEKLNQLKVHLDSQNVEGFLHVLDSVIGKEALDPTDVKRLSTMAIQSFKSSMHKASFDLLSKLFAEPLFLEWMSKPGQISFLKSLYFGIEQVDNLLVLAEWMRHAAHIEELRMETADVFIRYFNSEFKVVLLNKQTVVALLHLHPQKYLMDLDPLQKLNLLLERKDEVNFIRTLDQTVGVVTLTEKDVDSFVDMATRAAQKDLFKVGKALYSKIFITPEFFAKIPESKRAQILHNGHGDFGANSDLFMLSNWIREAVEHDSLSKQVIDVFTHHFDTPEKVALLNQKAKKGLERVFLKLLPELRLEFGHKNELSKLQRLRKEIAKISTDILSNTQRDDHLTLMDCWIGLLTNDLALLDSNLRKISKTALPFGELEKLFRKSSELRNQDALIKIGANLPYRVVSQSVKNKFLVRMQSETPQVVQSEIEKLKAYMKSNTYEANRMALPDIVEGLEAMLKKGTASTPHARNTQSTKHALSSIHI